jgi:DNA methylase
LSPAAALTCRTSEGRRGWRVAAQHKDMAEATCPKFWSTLGGAGGGSILSALIPALSDSEDGDAADEFDAAAGPAVSLAGDLWLLNNHRLYCGSALDAMGYGAILGSTKAAIVFTDPPYNVKIDGHVCGNGETKHREFAMASGEMTEDEFTLFLTKTLELASSHSARGALIYFCMDWRHMREVLTAGRATCCDLLNLCVWVKRNGGLGSFYRSMHELVFVFRNGQQAHLNNVQLGRFGPNRTNVWNYPGINGFARKGKERTLFLPPSAQIGAAPASRSTLSMLTLSP